MIVEWIEWKTNIIFFFIYKVYWAVRYCFDNLFHILIMNIDWNCYNELLEKNIFFCWNQIDKRIIPDWIVLIEHWVLNAKRICISLKKKFDSIQRERDYYSKNLLLLNISSYNFWNLFLWVCSEYIKTPEIMTLFIS